MNHIDTAGFAALLAQQLSNYDPLGRFTCTPHDVERAAWQRQDSVQKAEISRLKQENRKLESFVNFAEAQLEYWQSRQVNAMVGRQA